MIYETPIFRPRWYHTKLGKAPPGGGGGGGPSPRRVERSVWWIFTSTGVSAGWILTPTGVSNFHKNNPKRVAKYENFTNITQREWLKTKKWYPEEYVWHLNTQPEGVPEVKKGGLKGGTSLLTLTEGDLDIVNLGIVIFYVKLTFEMFTVRGQQHPYSTHERMFLAEGGEPQTFVFIPNALTIWAIRAKHLLSHVFEYWPFCLGMWLLMYVITSTAI